MALWGIGPSLGQAGVVFVCHTYYLEVPVSVRSYNKFHFINFLNLPLSSIFDISKPFLSVSALICAKCLFIKYYLINFTSMSIILLPIRPILFHSVINFSYAEFCNVFVLFL